MTTETTALTTTEQKELERLEDKIEKGVTGAKMALLEVRDQRLYRVTYGTFEAYCEQRWGITRRHGYRLLEAAEVCQEIADSRCNDCDTNVSLPNAREAAELAKLPKGERAAGWVEATETAPKKNGKAKTTAKHIQAVVAKRKKPESTPADTTSSPPDEPAKLDPKPWTQHNADAQRVVALMNEYMEIVERMAATPFGGWIEVKAHKGVANSTIANFEKWQVAGFKPQWEIGKDARNFFYAYELPTGGKK